MRIIKSIMKILILSLLIFLIVYMIPKNKISRGENIVSSQNIQYNNLILVNKFNPISKDYKANDMTIPSVAFGNVGNNMVQYQRKEVSESLERMFEAAKNEGINLIAISGYRSYKYQETIYSNEINNVGEIEANKYVAKPGTSEHQTGLAMDLLSDEYMELDEGFEDTEGFSWLKNNMSKYGFILRYPRGKEIITGYSYEPWHIRYVGTKAATEIMEAGITLEEYLDK